MRADGKARLVARLYARRLDAIEKNGSLWPAVEAARQNDSPLRHNARHNHDADNSLENKVRHNRQDRQDTQNAAVEKTGAAETRKESARGTSCAQSSDFSHGPEIGYDGYDGSDGASNSAGLSPSVQRRPVLTVLTGLSARVLAASGRVIWSTDRLPSGELKPPTAHFEQWRPTPDLVAEMKAAGWLVAVYPGALAAPAEVDRLMATGQYAVDSDAALKDPAEIGLDGRPLP